MELARENYAVIFHRYTNELALVTDMLDASNACLQAEVTNVPMPASISYTTIINYTIFQEPSNSQTL